ncbi:MAG: 2'-5' RNA ligase family protein [Rubrobacter sp.]|nr:2'-5' RNA ligase family protein [Rubrobacter sp.]
MGGYGEAWERFVSERRLEFGGHMDPGWQDGHALSASLIIPVESAILRERLDPLRSAVRPMPFVSLHPDHFMHITLFLLGFLVPEPEDEGEISPERLTDIEIRARPTLADFPAFDLKLANLNAFPGAAFVEVHDGGGIQKLRDALSSECGLKNPTGPPHMTLAYFQAPDGTLAPDWLISTIERYRDWPVGEMRVEEVELTLLDLRRDYPEPECLARIPLG